MKRLAFGICLVSCLAFGMGCTLRYSQTVIGSIESVESFKVVNSDSGVDVGLLAPYGITFTEPLGAGKVANYPCEVQFTQVDYRSKWYAYYIRVDFPKVEVTTYCVKRKKVASR